MVFMIYDISQEVLSCEVYPGDPAPKKESLCSIKNGDVCNLTAFSMCAHNGTHIDAPCHFFDDGLTIEKIDIERLVGYAYVAEFDGELDKSDAEKIIADARAAGHDAEKRILIKGNATVTLEAARVFADSGVFLVGNESQTVGPKDAPMVVHTLLLGQGIILLEGIRLSHVPVGMYLLNCAPISIKGADGAPCRAILIDVEHLV